MSISLTAELLWTKELCHVQELAKRSRREPGGTAVSDDAQIRRIEALTNALRGEHGRGLVKKLPGDLAWLIEITRQSEDLASTATELPPDLSEEVRSKMQHIALGDIHLGQHKRELRSCVHGWWGLVCEMFETDESLARRLKSDLLFLRSCSSQYRKANSELVAELEFISTRLRELMRSALVEMPEWELPISDELAAKVWTVRISPLAYLRAMWNLFWSAIRHPLSETTIDLSTGRVLYRT
ncbi:MAG: hypothetical protein U0792_15505 [Gemmataceae bacterium]